MVDYLSSKTKWRALLVLAIFLLTANLLKTAREHLWRPGYWQKIGLGARLNTSGDDLNATSGLFYADTVNWSDYAYCQYVTTEAYLCNSLMIFESLVRLGAKAERLMLYPEEWNVENSTSIGKLVAKARDEYGVRLEPITVQHVDGEMTWADSFTKLLAFNQTRYKRVLSLDSDSTVLRPMDELFLMPSAPVAMPRAYWLDDTLSSQLVLVESSKTEFARIQHAFETRGNSDFDMEIVNDLYGDSALIIPHRRYDLITGEFRVDPDKHFKYLGSAEEQWDPDKVVEEAKFLHFSDWPVLKPWLSTPTEVVDANMPQCRTVDEEMISCRDQELWLGFYDEFRSRRTRVCG